VCGRLLNIDHRREIAMSKNRHAMIHLSNVSTSGPYFSTRGLPNLHPHAIGMESASLSITEVEADDAELDNMVNDPRVLGVPAAFPIKLLKPTVALQAVGAASTAWGISEVGADVSVYDGTGLRPAVLDTGIDAMHPAFAGVNLVQSDFTGSGNGDTDGHGTHCAGTIFGRNVSGTRIGVARGVSEAMIGKVLGANGGDSTMLFKAIAWAINGGANVISMSLGFDFPGYVEQLINSKGYSVPMATSIALRDYTANLRAFDALMAFAKSQVPFTGGTVVVAASGNESVHPNFPISASVPAAADGVISVGAVQKTAAGLATASFSNTDCQIVAPGVDVLSAGLSGGTATLNGTSMACPHAAGVALLWWQALAAQGLPTNSSSVSARLIARASKARILGYNQFLHGNGVATAP
jgi:subtilisin family serine protease